MKNIIPYCDVHSDVFFDFDIDIDQHTDWLSVFPIFQNSRTTIEPGDTVFERLREYYRCFCIFLDYLSDIVIYNSRILSKTIFLAVPVVFLQTHVQSRWCQTSDEILWI